MERFFRYIGFVFEALILMFLFLILLPVKLLDGLAYKTSTK